MKGSKMGLVWIFTPPPPLNIMFFYLVFLTQSFCNPGSEFFCSYLDFNYFGLLPGKKFLTNKNYIPPLWGLTTLPSRWSNYKKKCSRGLYTYIIKRKKIPFGFILWNKFKTREYIPRFSIAPGFPCWGYIRDGLWPSNIFVFPIWMYSGDVMQ